MLCRLPGAYCVVVPANGWQRLNETQRAAILRHELAHLQRGDVWSSLLARLLAMPHWFNPLAWCAVRRFDEVGEWACDQQTVGNHPDSVPVYARAMLEIVQSRSGGVMSSAASGSALSKRLRRLLLEQPEDSVMKRCLVGVVLVALAGAGLLRVHLVAKEFDEERPVIEEAWDERIEASSARIDDNDPQLQRFVDVIHTPAGAVMLREHEEWAAETVRQQARSQALSHFIKEHFEEVGSELALRKDRDQFRDDFLQACHTFQTDVSHLAEAVRDIGRRLATDSEEERLFARFLQHDAGPTMLYAVELRQRLHPQERELENVLGDLFVRDLSGQYTIRPARRAQAERMLQRVERVHRALEPLHAELAAWADDIAPTDDLERQLKQTLREPPFAKFIASHMLLTDEEEHAPVHRFVEKFFEQLEDITEDTAEGLAVVPEARPEVEKWLRKSHAAVTMAAQLAGPVQKFAAQIRTGQPLEEHWVELMKGDLFLLRLANDFEVPETDSSQAVQSMFGAVLAEDADGTFRLQKRSNSFGTCFASIA